MGMKLTFLCCVAGELKDNIVGTTKNSRLFFYRAYEDQTIADMMEDGFFDGAQELRVDDLILLYDPNTKNEYEMVRIESTQGTVKTKKVDLLDVHKIYEILDEHQQEIDNNAALIAELDADVVHKSTATDILYGRKSNNEFDYIPKNDFDGVGSSEHIPTTAGIAKSFNTPLGPTNKGASMSEIGVLGNQIDALDAKIDIAGTSGKIVGSYWFGKTKANTVVPAPTLVGQNYYDFTTGQVYKSTDGTTWTLDGTNTPPADIDAQIIISSKFWDITEQDNQHGGKAWWSHTNSEWSYSPSIYEDKPAGGASLPLLTPIFADHQLNDASYLNANTFSWQAGSVYEAVYQHLVEDVASAANTTMYGYHSNAIEPNDIYSPLNTNDVPPIDNVYKKISNEIFVPISLSGTLVLEYSRETSLDTTGVIAETKDFDGINITYITAADGHRICLPDQETAISELYAKTGVAWFYILDTQNARFKLPRAKHNKYAETIPVVGNGIALGLTDGQVNYGLGKMLSGNVGFLQGGASWYGSSVGTSSLQGTTPNNNTSIGITTDGTKSGIVAQQEQDTDQYKYLYFYVGNFTKTAVENTAGLNAELFNNKVDLVAGVSQDAVDYVIATQRPTAENNYTWYRKYKSGWVEQGGITTSDVNIPVVFPIEMRDNKYFVSLTSQYPPVYITNYKNATTTSIIVNGWNAGAAPVAGDVRWQVSGMSAQ